MLMIGGTATVGSISGGCLETDLLEKAGQRLQPGKPQYVVYDMISDADVWGLNQGCNGIVHLLLETVSHPLGTLQFRLLHECLRGQKEGVMATIFRADGEVNVSIGSRVTLLEDGAITEDVKDPFLTSTLLRDCQSVFETGHSTHKEYELTGGTVEAFIEFIAPPIPLVIFGGGADAQPVARMAKELGWHVTVVDHRPAMATSAHFPTADVLLVARPEEYPERLLLGPQNAAVVMTHHFRLDYEIVKYLLPLSFRYLGLLGPRQRTELLLGKLREEGVQFSEEQLGRLHAPVGLDIGAEYPEEIALSILAEIQAVRSNRSGGSLKSGKRPIHS